MWADSVAPAKPRAKRRNLFGVMPDGFGRRGVRGDLSVVRGIEFEIAAIDTTERPDEVFLFEPNLGAADDVFHGFAGHPAQNESFAVTFVRDEAFLHLPAAFDTF